MDVLPVEVERLHYDVAGWGVGEIVSQGTLLLAHELPNRTRHAAVRAPGVDPGGQILGPTPAASGPTPYKGGTRPPDVTLAGNCAPVRARFVSDFVERVRSHLAGTETSYADIAIELSWCTPFQVELVAALSSVPWGEVVSYGELAALAGRPGAARAAGSFCAQNRFALVLPCHRVVGATGIGGYGESGVGLKRRLLALEGLEL